MSKKKEKAIQHEEQGQVCDACGCEVVGEDYSDGGA